METIEENRHTHLHFVDGIPQAMGSCQHVAVIQENALAPEVNFGRTAVIKVSRVRKRSFFVRFFRMGESES